MSRPEIGITAIEPYSCVQEPLSQCELRKPVISVSLNNKLKYIFFSVLVVWVDQLAIAKGTATED